MNYNGRYSSVTTPLTEISAKLYSLYEELNSKDFFIEKRLDTLLKLKELIGNQKEDIVFEMK